MHFRMKHAESSHKKQGKRHGVTKPLLTQRAEHTLSQTLRIRIVRKWKKRLSNSHTILGTAAASGGKPQPGLTLDD